MVCYTLFKKKNDIMCILTIVLLFLITRICIKDSDYKNLILFLWRINNLDSSKFENDFLLNNDINNYNDKKVINVNENNHTNDI